jgi:ABC-type anion transport system duplicated permease subunit
MKQLNGLFQNQIHLLPWLPYIAYILLVIIVIKLKGHSSGVTLMAFGIICTFIYCLFLIWIFLNRPLPQVNTFSWIKG